MTDKELKDLARKYAEANPPQTEDEKLKQYGVYLNATEVFEPFMRWLANTHFIISREKVKQLYKVALSNKTSQNISLQDSGIIQTSILETLFGKSTFEERSEK